MSWERGSSMRWAQRDAVANDNIAPPELVFISCCEQWLPVWGVPDGHERECLCGAWGRLERVSLPGGETVRQYKPFRIPAPV